MSTTPNSSDSPTAGDGTGSKRDTARGRRLRVETEGCPYEVVVGAGVIASLGSLLVESGIASPGARVFLAHDSELGPDVVGAATRALNNAGLRTTAAAVRATEVLKSLAGAEELLKAIARTRHERTDPVVALGGGIVGDVAGLAAAVYRRGVPVVQCPTTLLGMVDAAVGGKTAVNLEVDGELMKNLVGAFHQPRLVVADVEVLRSLPRRQMCSGLAECIKHGMIGAEFGEESLLDWIEENAEAILSHDAETLIELVARNVALKAAVVAQDEREERNDGGRALLNLGHTFGHAMETIPAARPEGAAVAGLHHGEAVALGLIAAAHCAQHAGVCPRELGIAERVTEVVQRCGLPIFVSGLPPAGDVLARMAHDKKVKGGVLRLVLPTAPGRAGLFSDPPVDAVLAGIEAIRAAEPPQRS